MVSGRSTKTMEGLVCLKAFQNISHLGVRDIKPPPHKGPLQATHRAPVKGSRGLRGQGNPYNEGNCENMKYICIILPPSHHVLQVEVYRRRI